MRDEIVAYLRKHEPVSSRELAEHFLKFKSPIEAMAHVAIQGILGADKRCSLGDDKLWHAASLPAENQAAQTFSRNRFIAVYLVSLSRVKGGQAVHVSIWTVDETPVLLHDQWLDDPDKLPQDEQEVLRSVRDGPYEPDSRDKLLFACENKIPVFLSSRDMLWFSECVARSDETRYTEDALVISTLMKLSKIPIPRPLSIDTCYQALFGTTPSLSYAYKYGECLANCVQELFVRLVGAGVLDLEASERDELSAFDFSQKGFSFSDIADAPVVPGVYGFKTKENDFLYIGKASNLRRRLMSYFRQTDESPEKIARIRTEAYGLITSVCGSELESLIYEYRLIKKHRPILNTQTVINERKGDYRPIDDCVILLPHAEAGKGMSFLFRKNQKILLRPFFSDFRDATALVTELNGFFFGTVLAANSEDFPEQEIVTRWVKQHQDELSVVFINRVANAKEALDSMRSVWKDLCEIQKVGSESAPGKGV
jgi:GIY-YIG catalytic domain